MHWETLTHEYTLYAIMMIAAMVIAAIGLALGIGSHIASLLGIPILDVDQVLVLHAGTIVVLIPVLVVANRMTRNGTMPGGWKMALSGCPDWARYALTGLFAYAILNCGYYLATRMGTFGDFTGAIRVFSSVWMLIYGAAFALLYSAIKTPHLFQTEQAPARPD